MGLTSVADVKFLHVIYFPTVTKDGHFVAVVVYAEGPELKADKKRDQDWNRQHEAIGGVKRRGRG